MFIARASSMLYYTFDYVFRLKITKKNKTSVMLETKFSWFKILTNLTILADNFSRSSF